MESVKKWLQDKQKRGVKDVRVNSVLAQFEISAAEQSADERELPVEIERLKAKGKQIVKDAQDRAKRIEKEASARVKEIEQAQLTNGDAVGRLDLVGTREAAEMLDVERPRIGRWKKNGIMPEPVAELKSGPVWFRSQIEGMKEEREKRRRVPISA